MGLGFGARVEAPCDCDELPLGEAGSSVLYSPCVIFRTLPTPLQWEVIHPFGLKVKTSLQGDKPHHKDHEGRF